MRKINLSKIQSLVQMSSSQNGFFWLSSLKLHTTPLKFPVLIFPWYSLLFNTCKMCHVYYHFCFLSPSLDYKLHVGRIFAGQTSLLGMVDPVLSTHNTFSGPLRCLISLKVRGKKLKVLGQKKFHMNINIFIFVRMQLYTFTINTYLFEGGDAQDNIHNRALSVSLLFTAVFEVPGTGPCS